jgi:heme A synthase
LTVIVVGLILGAHGASLRLCAVLALVAVMIQGLLGGFRVKLNELVGTDLAAFHGVFAQVVFGLLVSVAALTARPDRTTGASASRLARSSFVLAGLVFVQVIFGAWVRHYPAPLPQRLHFLTAFLATALAVWLLRAVFADSAARLRAGWISWALAGLLVLQLYLGVEAWMAKFGPEQGKITPVSGAIRSLHALVGSGVWAAALALALRLRTPRAPINTLEPIGAKQSESRSRAVAQTV